MLIGRHDEQHYAVALVYPNGAMEHECHAKTADDAKRFADEKNRGVQATQFGWRYVAYNFERVTIRTVIE